MSVRGHGNPVFPVARAACSAPASFLPAVSDVRYRIVAASAYDYALNLLAGRAYPARNLRRKLVQKGYEEADISAAIDRLVASGLVDDARFAEQFARSRLHGHGSSKLRLRQQLFQRGIPTEVSAAAIERVLDEDPVDLEAIVERAARRKLASMGDLEPGVLRRRLYAHLARAGYNPDEIRTAIRKVLETP